MVLVNILYSGLGGHSSVVFSIIEADVNKEYTHFIIFYGIEEIPQSYINKCRELGCKYVFIKKQQGIDLASYKNVQNTLKEISPDIILLHSVNLIVPVYKFTYGKKIKLISVEHQANLLKTKKDWAWSALIMFLSDKVVYLTELYSGQMKKHLRFLYQPSKVSVINNGINISLFKPSSILTNEHNSIGMLSRLSTNKDHITLINAFKIIVLQDKYNTLRLKIAGDGETKEVLKLRAKEIGISESVDFVGMIPEHLNPVFLNALTVYVHASYGETMSTALMQAMACGKPVIASDVQGINNMIKNGQTGILVRPEDPESLAEELMKMLDNNEIRKTFSENALQFAKENFSNSLMFERYRKLFI